MPPARRNQHGDIEWMMSSPKEPSSASPATSGTDYQPGRSYFENTYARLPERFHARLNPTPVAAPRLIKLNTELARIRPIF
jgi:hypothetical protein